jgi:hypothetical protein
MSTEKLTTKQLRKLARDLIELETSYQVVDILNVDKSGVVKIKCKTTFQNTVEILAIFKDGKARIESPGMGTLLVKKI